MRIIADFHIHSKYSRATSRDMDIDHISEWAAYKGIDIVGSGDFTHPLWFGELKSKLREDGSGILSHNNSQIKNKFILSSEISCIYSQDGKTRKIHLIVLAPDLDSVSRLNDRLLRIGNIASDGRPILGISAKDLTKLILDINSNFVIIPAHAWTPWFSLFGSNSGFDSIEECFGNLSAKINSIETGLSSDPEMNWQISALDKIALISNSDAHSPANLGREANVFEIEGPLTYQKIVDAIKSKDPKIFRYTIEFFPEEGKYHFDGHRNCDVVINPFKENFSQNLCPKCHKKLTIGVLSRVKTLADRTDHHPENVPASKHLVPLLEIIGQVRKTSPSSKGVLKEYFSMVNGDRPELNILLDMSEDELTKNFNHQLVDGIKKVRSGKIKVAPGYDGVYGKVDIFGGDSLNQQYSLF